MGVKDPAEINHMMLSVWVGPHTGPKGSIANEGPTAQWECQLRG